MRAYLNFQLALFLVYCIYGSFVSCIPANELLREDLALARDVPLNDEDYELVQIWHREFKSGDDNMKELRFKRSGNDVRFTMKETSLIRENTPVYLIYSDTNITKADDNIISDAVRFYEQPEVIATFASDFDEYNHQYFLGSISQAAVAPLSKRTARSLKAEKPHLFENSVEPGSADETGEFTATDYHIIYNIKLPENGTIILPPLGHPELFNKQKSEITSPAHQRLRRTAADVVYPEILAILDYKQRFTTIYEFRFLSLLMYTIAFWNTINHRYESLKDPQIRLRLTGIAVVMDREQLSIMKKATVDDMLNARDMIYTLPQWLGYKIKGEYDLIVVQTNSKLCDQPREAPYCAHSGLLGLANVGPSCPWGRRTLMTGVFHDDMNHSGVTTAAHEVGHILGANHDESTSPDECIDTNGYIMSWNARYHSKPYEWSSCSKKNISDHLRKILSSCLDNPAPTGSFQGSLVDTEILPGKKILPEYQCLLKGYTRACEATNVCENLSCKWWWCVNAGPALEGTPCPEGQCHNGKCVPKS